MRSERHYRHELKYTVPFAEYLALTQKLKYIMKPDEHTDSSGRYRVISLYFDNDDDKALREKIEGVNLREKFRLRYYDFDTNRILLEKKQKINGLCLKTSVPISFENCQKLLLGQTDWAMEKTDPMVKELLFKMAAQRLKPKTIVSYIREPYVYTPGNVRVTFDMDIRTGIASTFFLDPDTAVFPVNTNGKMILEIKYDSFLPQLISELIQTGQLRANAFSKYAACRQYV